MKWEGWKAGRLEGWKIGRLVYACAHHSQDITQAEITVQTCWDADRLDLGRIGIKPDARYLCTPAAREPAIIEWAFRRSQGAPHDFRNTR